MTDLAAVLLTMPRLYHYTGAEHVAPIQAEGITQGALYLPVRETLYRRWLWLTDSADWRQGWATQRMTHCDRTEARFEVSVPADARHRLFRWHDVAANLGLSREYVRRFDDAGGGGGEHWWLYHGTIPPAWLSAVEWRPTAGQRQGPHPAVAVRTRGD